MTTDEIKVVAQGIVGPYMSVQPNTAGAGIVTAIVALCEQVREGDAATVRQFKYSDRGDGLDDVDPHSDNNPDYMRAVIDEVLEEAATAICVESTDSNLPSWADPNCGCCGGSGYTSLGRCYVCQKRAATIAPKVNGDDARRADK